MAHRVEVGGLRIDARLHRLVREEIAPGTGVKADSFWKSLGAIVSDLGLKNRELLAKRDHLQKQIDQWHLARMGQPFNVKDYTAFLREVGYLVPAAKHFKII